MKNFDRIFSCDFETTVDERETRVWIAGSCELFAPDKWIHYFFDIEDMFNYFWKIRNCNTVLYFHNLKFDGSFWVDFLLNHKKLKMAGFQTKRGWRYYDDKAMSSSTYRLLINSAGEWFGIKIKKPDKKYIIILDSYKILPISIRKIAEKFNMELKKGSIDYEKKREPGYIATAEEKEYIKNDVLILKKGLEEFATANEGKIDGLTIGSMCWKEWRNTLGMDSRDSYFQYKNYIKNLFDYYIDPDIFGCLNAYAYINQSYYGGWVYAVPGKMHKKLKNGITADCNGLYSYVMHSKSGNAYPVGTPQFFVGKIPDQVKNNPGKYYVFLKFECQFKLKDGFLPFIRVKNNLNYNGQKALETSDIFYKGKYYDKYRDFDGNLKPATVELTLTETDFKLFKKHYDIYNFKILSGCFFEKKIGLFDDYINKYAYLKEHAKSEAERQVAKLFLNNLAGKFAQSRNSSYKVPFKNDDGVVLFYDYIEFELQGGYIPIGAAVTSYARWETINKAQSNYNGPDAPGFCYSDTDSIHCDETTVEDLKNIKIDKKELGAWKIEADWSKGYFFRKKGYIEKEKESQKYILKCAGLSERCKKIFLASIGEDVEELEELRLDQEEKEYIKKGHKVEDLRPGLTIPGNLKQKKIKGGAVLIKEEYKMRELS